MKPRRLHRVLVANDNYSAVSVGHSVVDNRSISRGYIGDRLASASPRRVLEVALELSRKQCRNRFPAIPRPVGKLTGLGEPPIDFWTEFVRPGNSGSCFHGTHEWRRENQCHRGGCQMLARSMHLLNPSGRETEPREVSVHDMIRIEDLSVADEV